MSIRSTILATLALLGAMATAPQAQTPTLATVMNEKADNTARLLRPLVTADFALLDRYAERLGRLTYTEVASWQARPDTAYMAQANKFIAGVHDLRDASARHDLTRAAAAYRALVDSCVECHRIARAGRAVSLTLPGPSVNGSPR